jgi:hypothetical protein
VSSAFTFDEWKLAMNTPRVLHSVDGTNGHDIIIPQMRMVHVYECTQFHYIITVVPQMPH